VDLFPRQATMITKCALFGDLKIAAFFVVTPVKAERLVIIVKG
jgi:hypothetical protein